ncbi:GNAT family N-acetyltransferase [Chondromyces crocatus]|uniref:GNAT family N-acetyltransferase n=1 Tax=Chondromyces crocatus TaxID=52 RepID=UPI001FDF675E|nr:GNAT family N-acetyltransferase [Chondromyces crocatus]
MTSTRTTRCAEGRADGDTKLERSGAGSFRNCKDIGVRCVVFEQTTQTLAAACYRLLPRAAASIIPSAGWKGSFCHHGASPLPHSPRRSWYDPKCVPHPSIFTPRLELVPITVPLVEAVMRGRRDDVEAILAARMPTEWPGPALIERAFSASLDLIRAAPLVRLWGDRVMISREGARRVIGSVVFHGAPDEDGSVEVAYGVEHESQQQGFATEATEASVLWALQQPGVRLVKATTPTWHTASRRVLEKCGFCVVGSREGDLVGELLEFERCP